MRLIALSEHYTMVSILSTTILSFSLTSSRMGIVKQTVYTIATLTARVSIIFLFLRYFRPSHSARCMIWIGMVVISLFYTSTIIASLGLCVPRPGEGWSSKEIARKCGHPIIVILIMQGVFSVLCDAYLLAIPLIQVLRLHVSASQKFGLVAVFFMGLM